MAHNFNVSHKLKLDSPERRKLFPPNELLQGFDIGPGAIIEDIGIQALKVCIKKLPL